MITEERKAQLAQQYASDMERYLDKQWVDSDIANNAADDEEERKFLHSLSYWIETSYTE